MKKILILNDIHHGTSRSSTSHPGYIRQANNEALETLARYVGKFINSHYDLVVNLGDMVRDTGKIEDDKKLLKEIMSVFTKINGNKLYIPGNHELKEISSSELKQILPQDLNYEKVGKMTMDDWRILWLDCELGEKDIAHLSKESLKFLQDNIEPDSKVILFSHYSIIPLNGKDNFYFDNDYKYMSYTNGIEIQKILSNCNRVISINAHTHMGTYKNDGNLTSISALSFSENIVAEKYPEANPGIYSTLEIDEDKVTFRSYSGEFCFLNIEI